MSWIVQENKCLKIIIFQYLSWFPATSSIVNYAITTARHSSDRRRQTIADMNPFAKSSATRCPSKSKNYTHIDTISQAYEMLRGIRI